MSVSRWDSILTLTVFFVTNIAVIFPFRVPIPVPNFLGNAYFRTLVSVRVLSPSDVPNNPGGTQFSSAFIRWTHIKVDFLTAPLFAVLLLLVTRAIDGEVLRTGIVGTNGVQPLDIMALFMSLAYMTISLDVTGLFRFLALWVVRKGGSSGRKLYFYLYMFFLVSGILLGNDAVILSGTAFLAYFSSISGIVPPTAWIFAQFAVANMTSAVLPPSNLTNLVLTGAFAIPFLTFAAHTVIPILLTAFAIYPFLAFILFNSRAYIPARIEVIADQDSNAATGSPAGPDVANDIELEARGEPEPVAPAPSALTDKFGAIFGSIVLGTTLVVLLGTSPLRIPVWEVTVPAAVVMIVRDVWHDRKRWSWGRKPQKQIKTECRLPTGDLCVSPCVGGIIKQIVDVELLPTRSSTSIPHAPTRKTASSMLRDIRKEYLPTLSTIVPRLPLALFPFTICMFILVQAVAVKDWIQVFASWWKAWIRVCELSSSNAGAAFGAIAGMTVLSTLLCNICGTNIGMTILLAHVVQIWLEDSTTVSPRMKNGTIYALAIGSNIGAFSLSFSASLAGLLWRSILRQKGIHVRQRQFALLNLPIVSIAMCISSCALLAEVAIIYSS